MDANIGCIVEVPSILAGILRTIQDNTTEAIETMDTKTFRREKTVLILGREALASLCKS